MSNWCADSCGGGLREGLVGWGGLQWSQQRLKTGQKQMTLCNGGFLPFELGELTGKFNHPLEQVPYLYLILILMPLQCLSILAHMCMKLTYTTPSAYHQLWALAEKVRVRKWNDIPIETANQTSIQTTTATILQSLRNSLSSCLTCWRTPGTTGSSRSIWKSFRRLSGCLSNDKLTFRSSSLL